MARNFYQSKVFVSAMFSAMAVAVLIKSGFLYEPFVYLSQFLPEWGAFLLTLIIPGFIIMKILNKIIPIK